MRRSVTLFEDSCQLPPFLGLDLIKAIIQTVMTNADLMWGVWSWVGAVYIGLKGDIAIKMSDIISDCHGLRTTNFDCG